MGFWACEYRVQENVSDSLDLNLHTVCKVLSVSSENKTWIF